MAPVARPPKAPAQAARPPAPPGPVLTARPVATRPPPVLSTATPAGPGAPPRSFPLQLTPETRTSEALSVRAAPPAARAPPVAKAPAPAGELNLTPDQISDLLDRSGRLPELDYFALLKLDFAASPADIKNAFYRESRTYHPDRFFQLEDALIKERVHDLYKRVTEAYFVLRDDVKRKRYLADLAGPDRAQRLRFTEASESETKAQSKKDHDEQVGSHPKGRQFFQTALGDIEAERYGAAERNLKMAMTYEPQNTRYKERLDHVRGKLQDANKADPFKIK